MRQTPPLNPSPTPPPKASWQWDSPLPYLFAGLGLMLLLITASLVVLACSYRKRRSPPSDLPGEKPAQFSAAVTAADDTPKVVVIMAGEDNPTHLAVPIHVSSL